MTRHPVDPTRYIRPQIRALDIPEPLKHEQTILYRFFDTHQALLYVGVTRRPYDRWQVHMKSSPWWPLVSELSFEMHPHERAALDAEVAAIRAERPLFNRRSAHTSLTDSSPIPHEESRSYSGVVLPRVGGGVGVGGRGGYGAIHASRLTRRESLPVDNADAATTPDRLAWMAADAAEIGGGR